MINFIVGFIFGVAACTIGFTGIVKVADDGVGVIQNTIKKAE
jgi:hypothetical protein